MFLASVGAAAAAAAFFACPIRVRAASTFLGSTDEDGGLAAGAGDASATGPPTAAGVADAGGDVGGAAACAGVGLALCGAEDGVASRFIAVHATSAPATASAPIATTIGILDFAAAGAMVVAPDPGV